MTKFKRNIIATLLAGAMLLSSGCVNAETTTDNSSKWETWYVSANSGLNCRTKPYTDKDSRIIRVYNRGAELQIIGIDDTGKWWETRDGETQGWCYSTYFIKNKDVFESAPYDNGNSHKGRYVGTFKITHYCPNSCCNGGWGNHTAWAGEIIPGQTIAVDPSVIGRLQHVYIDGYGVRRAEDCGGGVKGNHIDMAVPTHAEALAKGVVYRDVYLAE